MSVDVTILTKLLDRLSQNYRLDLRSCEDRLKVKIDKLPIPEAYRYLFASHWPQTPDLGFINGYHISSGGQLLSTENVEQFLPCQLFAIGSSVTGDTLVLDFTTAPAQVAVVSHDEWEPGGNSREVMATVAGSLEEFLRCAIDDIAVPSDYYEALDRHAL